ncbi:MAG: hypothetical protein ACO25B_11830 [Chitinophagaceae bacterium]
MARICGAFTLFLYLIASCPSYSQDQRVMIRVVQEETSMLHDFQTNILLERRPFKFEILLKNVEGVYVFASIRDSVYRFTETSIIQDFTYLNLLELREEDIYNTNRELNISEDGWSYWFYKPEPEKHTFNHKVIRFDSSRIVCTKVIKQLFDVAESKVMKLRDVKSPLYLFFVAVAEYDSQGRPSKELLRRKVRIEWINED